MSSSERVNHADYAGCLETWCNGLLRDLVLQVEASQPGNSALHAIWARLKREDLHFQVCSMTFPRVSAAELAIPASHVTRAKDYWDRWRSMDNDGAWYNHVCRTLFQSSDQWFTINLFKSSLDRASTSLSSAVSLIVSVQSLSITPPATLTYINIWKPSYQLT